MKAVVFHGIGDIRLDDVAEPKLQDATDAIVRITASAICGTDLHMIRGTLPGMKDGRVLGHEAVGVIEEVGDNVRNLRPGDRVVVPSTIACGYCSYCRAGYYAQCDNANPNGRLAGTAFYGGPESTGGFNGMQAEFVRVPFAHVNLVRLPDAVNDEQAILISDIFPTGYFGADLAEINYGDTVAVFGCGPVGLFTIASAGLMGAGRILAVDQIPSRLDMARAQGAEVIDFSREDPVEAIRELTGGIGADRVIDAVGIDAVHPHGGPGDGANAEQFEQEVKQVAPDANPHDGNWEPGDAPSQALRWCVESVAKAGTVAIIGVYSPQMQSFPIGEAMMKNLTLKMGNCNHRRYIPDLVNQVKSDVINPLNVLTQREPLVSAIDAYKTFDKREAGWTKVALVPGAAA
ncbi:MAG TPA: zinc-dependent alcohol dehydrogenase [Gammaproteobacteria bacterium]|nr:zinc-dependent alcohol dehydrogenase [Gammaproteobacteria bacterium]